MWLQRIFFQICLVKNCLYIRVLKLSGLKRPGKRLFIHPCSILVRSHIPTYSIQGAHLRGGVRSTSSRLREDLQAVVNSLHLINLMACVQLICYCSPSLNAFVGLWLENISCDDDICGKNWANRCQMVTRPVGWLKLPASPIGFCQFY